jgi:methyl-accepting chemotaxis protein
MLSNRIFGSMADSMEQGQFDLMRSIVEFNLKGAEKRALARAEMIAGLPNARALLSAGDRPGLLAEYKDMFQTQKDKHGVDQAQFHVKPATSFLRLHDPEKFGDDLSQFRPIVVAVNNDHVARTGVAIARSGPAVFAVAPVFDLQNQHIGSFEFGIAFEGILDSLKDAYSLEMAVLFSEEPLHKFALGLSPAIFSDQKRVGSSIRYHATNSELMKELVTEQDLNGHETQYVREVLGVFYGVILMPIRNGAGDVIGTVVAARDFNALRSASNRSIVWQALMALFSIVGLAGVILVVLRGVLLRPLEEITEHFAALENSAQPGELEEQELLCDELQGLALQYERLRALKAGDVV